MALIDTGVTTEVLERMWSVVSNRDSDLGAFYDGEKGLVPVRTQNMALKVKKVGLLKGYGARRTHSTHKPERDHTQYEVGPQHHFGPR